jgi:hypothetical protein
MRRHRRYRIAVCRRPGWVLARTIDEGPVCHPFRSPYSNSTSRRERKTINPPVQQLRLNQAANSSITRLRRSHLLQEFDKLLSTVPCLLNNRSERLPLQILVVKGDGYSQLRPRRVLEDVMGAARVVNEKTGPLKGAEDFFRLERWKSLAHADQGRATSTSSLTGSALSLMSSGMGKPSLWRLSK